MSKVTGIFDIVLRVRDETERVIEYHFPVREGDKAVAEYFTEIVPGQDFPMGGDMTLVGMDRIVAVKLEILAQLGKPSKWSDEPLMWYWFPEGMSR